MLRKDASHRTTAPVVLRAPRFVVITKILMNNRKLSIAIRAGLICAAVGNGLAVAADEKSSDLDTVVVTGTRIGRDAGFESPVPMVTLDAQAINASGFAVMGDVLFNLPQVAVNASLQGTGTAFSAGQSRVDLRGLDSSRTLVLLDGRRFITGDFRTPGVDLNLIPSSMIERIDVISGGASAVYG
jgi:iron complex outermembrane receptor protein